LRRGGDATIISTGTLMYEAILASDLLAKDFGIRAEVFQMASIKPLDTECVLRAAERTGNIVTIEDHSIIGGLGSAVSEVVAEKGKARVRRIGIRDHFCGVGTYAGLKEKEGLDVNNIVKTLRNLLKHK
jgi:transketolase